MKNLLFIIGAVGILAGLIFFGIFSQGNILGSVGNNEVEYITEDLNMITWKVTATNPQGSMFSGAVGGEINDLSFGETIISDTRCRSDNIPLDFEYGNSNGYERDMQTRKYEIKNINFEGLVAYVDYQSDNQRQVNDILLKNPQGYCKPVPAYKVNLNCGRFSGKYRCDTAQGFECVIESGELKAYENGQEVSAVFSGLSQVSVEVETWKLGYEPQESQSPKNENVSSDSFEKPSGILGWLQYYWNKFIGWFKK